MNLSNLVSMMSLLILITPLMESIITLGGMMILTPLLSTIIIAKMINSWFAMILFLIYISGLLVLFGYMMAMSPNPKSFNKNLMIYIILGFSMCSFQEKKSFFFPKSNLNYENEVFFLFQKFNLPVYWLMTINLLITLVMVVYICFKSQKPLRPFLT
uniref:NADH dehydrogenase subunit 6 n=1 Tax=Bugula neritina TaxID=10212 RepID=A0A1B0QVW0_BUGNE|nr:NADH dehydrogenase subunit 6 [Bugula neritina]